MAFEKIVRVAGDQVTYVFNEALKKYALSDTGFVQNNAGAYVMQRSLEPDKGLAKAIKLKVIVDKNLSGVKIKTINPTGTANVNIFKNESQKELVTLYRFYLDELVNRDILQVEEA